MLLQKQLSLVARSSSSLKLNLFWDALQGWAFKYATMFIVLEF